MLEKIIITRVKWRLMQGLILRPLTRALQIITFGMCTCIFGWTYTSTPHATMGEAHVKSNEGVNLSNSQNG
jgi:hypothetical protein